MTDRGKEQREQTLASKERLHEELELWAGLQKHEAFQEYLSSMQSNLKVLRDEYELGKTTGIDDLVVREYVRGELAATRLWANFVELKMTNLREGLKMLSQQAELEFDFMKEQEDGE